MADDSSLLNKSDDDLLNEQLADALAQLDMPDSEGDLDEQLASMLAQLEASGDMGGSLDEELANAAKQEAEQAEQAEPEQPEAWAEAEEWVEPEGWDDSDDDESAVFIDEEALLDYELSEALERDKAAGADVELEESIDDFVKDVSVYTDPGDFETPVARGRFYWLEEKINAISPKFLAAAIGVLGVFSLTVLGLAFLMMHKSAALNSELESRGTIIRTGASTANSTDYIYVDEKIALPDGFAKLIKIGIGRTATVLAFDRFIDMSRYDATLTDNLGMVYNLDRSYYESDAAEETRMWFNPFLHGTKSFTLKLHELESDSSTLNKFSTGQELSYDNVRYITQPISVDCDSETAAVEIGSAIFSNISSQINYALEWHGSDERIVLSKPGSDEYFSLIENGRLIPRETYSFEQFAFENNNTVIGRVDFLPVQSLESGITLQFENMYKLLAVNREVSLADIFYTKPSHEVRIDVGSYELVLERGGIQVDQYILVMHARDKRLEAVSNRSNRVRAFLDVTMVARREDGSEIELSPKLIRDAAEGTDIVFDGSEERAFLVGLPIENVFFKIKGLYAKLPTATVELELLHASRKLDLNQETAIDAVKRAFDRRLGYKSGTSPRSEVDRFSDSVMGNTALMREYAPEWAVNPSTAVHFTAWHLAGDRFYAALRDTWRADGADFFHRSHKIAAEYGERGWIITEDELLE